MRTVAMPLSLRQRPRPYCRRRRESCRIAPLRRDGVDGGDWSDDLEVHAASSLDRSRRTPVSAAAEGRRLHAEVTRLRSQRTRPLSSASVPVGRPASGHRYETRWPRGLTVELPRDSRLQRYSPVNPGHGLPSSSLPARLPPCNALPPSSFLLLETGLLEYGIQGTGRDIQTLLASHGDGPWLALMFVLPMTSASSRQAPSILFKKPDQFADLHAFLNVTRAAV